MQPKHKFPTRTDLWIVIGLAIISLGVYGLTLTPSLSYASPDGNELATVPYVLGLAHSPGYPLYTWLGKAFTVIPIGDVAYRMNLMSATLGAASIGMLYWILIILLPEPIAPPNLRRAGSVSACLLLAFSSTFWSQAVIAEVYIPNLALITFTLLLLLRWERTQQDRDFFLFALIFGLSLGTHISNLGFAIGFAIFILLIRPKVLRRVRWWIAGIVGFGLGIAQFLWLPLRASSLNDRPMLARAPLNLTGIYNYTLGSFPQLKFAFPLGQIPDRIVLYLDLLRDELGLFAILLGVIGLGSLLVRRTRYFFLLVGMYLVHVWFFVQYRAFDLEVFFLPAHLLWTVFITFGLIEVVTGIQILAVRGFGVRVQRTAGVLLVICTLAGPLRQLLGNWQKSDQSSEVAIDDFFSNLWEQLPQDSVLLTQGGVFGYDAFYWQLVYEVRPDVLLPMLPSPTPEKENLADRDVFSTTPINSSRGRGGPGALPPDLIDPDVWQIPILLGSPGDDASVLTRNRLILFQVSDSPPEFLVSNLSSAMLMNADLGDVLLVGVELEQNPVESGGTATIKLYWEVQKWGRHVVSLFLDGTLLTSYELGFGNLARYNTQVHSLQGEIFQETYEIVIPSNIPAGSQQLEIRLFNSTESVQLGVIEVIDQEETMERWLKIAGR